MDAARAVSCLLACALLLPVAAAAESPVDLSKLKSAMEKAVLARENIPPKLKGGEANILEFRITGVRVNGEKPKLQTYWVIDELRPVFVCAGGQPKQYTETRSITDRSELTLTETMGLKATVDVSVKGSSGAVEGTVAAGLEASVEKGRSMTTGQEVSATTGQTWTILPGTGEWVGAVGERYSYKDAPYEVDVEVLKATVRTPLMPVTWIPRTYGGNKPLTLTAKGRFSASIIDGALEINSVPMTQDELSAHCTGTGRPTQARRVARGAEVPSGTRLIKHP